MKTALIFMLILCSACVFAQPFLNDAPVEPPKPLDQQEHAWTTTLALNSGEFADLYALTPATCSIGWARITGKAKVNGMETTFVSWARPSKCVVVAIEACTVEMWGK